VPFDVVVEKQVLALEFRFLSIKATFVRLSHEAWKGSASAAGVLCADAPSCWRFVRKDGQHGPQSFRWTVNGRARTKASAPTQKSGEV